MYIKDKKMDPMIKQRSVHKKLFASDVKIDDLKPRSKQTAHQLDILSIMGPLLTVIEKATPIGV